jgi:polyhydroxyalkanoate synthesis repressor PhaR
MATVGTTMDDRASDMESEVVQIKRYPNRRFYARSRREYITLQGIEELVRRGVTVEVRDSRNDEDLTRLVLTQILLERQPERMETFPTALLHMLLRANDLALESLRVFMRLSLAAMESIQESGRLTPFVSPLDWMRMFFPGFAPKPRSADVVSDGTVERLLGRVAELEERLRHLESEARRPSEKDSLSGLPDSFNRRIERQGSH